MEKLDKIENLLEEADQRCKLLSQCLPKRVDHISISYTAKIPWKAMGYREALIWRTEELARTAHEMFARNDLASAVTLTRACMESVAAMWYLQEKIQHVIDTKVVGDINDILMRLLMGSKNDITSLDAVNVLTFVKNINKDIDGFENSYLSLCEYAHPNWSGTSFLYSKPNSENKWIDYGKNIRGKESVSVIGLTNLNISLMIFERSYNKVDTVLVKRKLAYNLDRTFSRISRLQR